jgi:hypothetical protein
MKEEFNKDTEILRKKESNRNPGNKNFLNQTKNTDENHSSTLEQLEDRISGHKDKIDIKEKTEEFLEDSRAPKSILKNSVIPSKHQIYESWASKEKKYKPRV